MILFLIFHIFILLILMILYFDKGKLDPKAPLSDPSNSKLVSTTKEVGILFVSKVKCILLNLPSSYVRNNTLFQLGYSF